MRRQTFISSITLASSILVLRRKVGRIATRCDQSVANCFFQSRIVHVAAGTGASPPTDRVGLPGLQWVLDSLKGRELDVPEFAVHSFDFAHVDVLNNVTRF